MSDPGLACEAFITKTHFLCSMVLGSSEDSDTSQIELEQMDCANPVLFTKHWTESLT